MSWEWLAALDDFRNCAAFLCADLDLTLEPREELAAYTDFINGLQPAASAG